ncbi:MAG: hypothetical protein V1755_01475 [Chloroflexota bacterium]
MKQDRFLLGILIGIAVLVAAALAVFFTRQQQVSYRPEQAPQDVVHNYVLAILNKDYEKAYAYLADLKDKPSFGDFRQAFAVGRLTPGQNGIKIGSSDVTADSASVEVIMVYTPGDPFSSGYDNVGSAQLLRQNGAWKLSSMPAYNLWDFGWYQAKPK